MHRQAIYENEPRGSTLLSMFASGNYNGSSCRKLSTRALNPMAITSKCPACGEPISLSADASRSRFACPACGIGLTTNENGDLAVEAVRSATTSIVAAVPKPPPKLDDADEDDEWDEEVANQRRWLQQRHRRDAALRKVKAPAIFLQVVGILMILGSVALAVLAAILPSLSQNKNDDDFLITMTILYSVGGAVSLMIGIANFWAGRRMKALRSYGSVLAIVIMTLILGAMLCIFLAVV